MIDTTLIANKLSDLQGYYSELELILVEEARTIIDDNLKLHSVERLFQLIVDTAVDINTHLIVESGFPFANDYQSTFMTLGEHKILPMDFALQIAPSVGLRNLIVHKYGKVDIKRMVDDIKNEIGQYRIFMGFVDAFLKNVHQ